MHRFFLPAIFLAFCLSHFQCNYSGSTSGIHYFLDMHDSLAVEDQEEDYSRQEGLPHDIRSTLSNENTENVYGMDAVPARSGLGSSIGVPPEGSVPRNYTPYPYKAADFAVAAEELRNPYNKLSVKERKQSVYPKGQKKYNTYCSPCHGFRGGGDGSISYTFSDIPSVVRKDIELWSDGELFHMITMGRGRMLPYAAQLLPEERWAVVSYIRLLQKNYGDP